MPFWPRSPRPPARPGPSLTPPPARPSAKRRSTPSRTSKRAVAAAAGRPAGVGCAGPRRPVRRAAQGRRRRRTLRRGTRPAALPRAGQTAQRPQRPLRGRRLRRLAARRRRHAAGPGNRGGRRRNPRRTALPAHRRRRRHRPLELAHDDHRLADRPRPAHGQRRRGQALRIHPAVRPGPGRKSSTRNSPKASSPWSPAAATSAHGLAEHPAIGKIMFTGSTATGKAIIRSSADTVKRLTLELGGNDAGIVLPDADPKAIAEGLFWGAFINTGQTCAALKRLYVHDDIYDAVCEELTAVAAAMPMGNGLDEDNVLGPLQNKASSSTSSPGSWRPPGTPAPGSCSAATRTRTSPATSTPPPWWPTSTTTTRSSPRNSSAPPCRSSATAPWTRPSPWPTRLDVGLGASVWSSDPAEARKVAARHRGRHRLDQQARRRGPPRPLRRRQAVRLRPGIRRRRPQSPRRPAGHQRLSWPARGSARCRGGLRRPRTRRIALADAIRRRPDSKALSGRRGSGHGSWQAGSGASGPASCPCPSTSCPRPCRCAT